MRETAESPWRCLRVPLAIFAVTVLAGAGSTGAAWWHEQGAVERSNEAAARLTEAHRRYAALGDERRQWRHFGRLYRLWASHGRIGDGDATRWADAVRVASAEVASASHRLGMPRGAEHDGGIEVRAFDMSVELGMRHEGELRDFLSLLEREARGLFVVSGCRLVRSGSGGTGPPKRPAIDASCRLRWMTVTLSGVEPGWTPPAADGAGDDAVAGVSASLPDTGAAAPEAFGRLFTTAAERALIDSSAAARTAEAKARERTTRRAPRPEPSSLPVRWVDVEGLVARSGHSVFAWIDGKRVNYRGRSNDRTTPSRTLPPGVRLEAGGRWIAVRPGQRFDPATGRITDPVRDPVRRNAFRSERVHFLRKSSRAPLTDPAPPGQN